VGAPGCEGSGLLAAGVTGRDTVRCPDGRPGEGWQPGRGNVLSGGSFLPQQFGMGGFASPYYAYGLTKRAADDISFIARFAVIMIWLWIIAVGLLLLGLVVQFQATLAFLAALAGGLFPR
jgi:hypothetical protein